MRLCRDSLTPHPLLYMDRFQWFSDTHVNCAAVRSTSRSKNHTILPACARKEGVIGDNHFEAARQSRLTLEAKNDRKGEQRHRRVEATHRTESARAFPSTRILFPPVRLLPVLRAGDRVRLLPPMASRFLSLLDLPIQPEKSRAIVGSEQTLSQMERDGNSRILSLIWRSERQNPK